MFWNHRVLKRIDHGEPWYAIHEVHYDDDGTVETCTLKPDAIEGESVEELRDTLTRMLACLDRPVLDYESIGEQRGELHARAGVVEGSGPQEHK